MRGVVWCFGRMHTPMVELYRAQRDLNIALSRTALPRGYRNMNNVRRVTLSYPLSTAFFNIHEFPMVLPDMRPLPQSVLAGIVSVFPEMVYDVAAYVVRVHWLAIPMRAARSKGRDVVRDYLRNLARHGHARKRAKEQSPWIAQYIPPAVLGWEGHWQVWDTVLEKLSGVYRDKDTGLILYRPEEDEALLNTVPSLMKSAS
ncbi:MAG: hypothetical protein ACUVS5_13015 [Anaerolineae bacterium]